jgi:hypothetical protein
MPYAMSVMGSELLAQCFGQQADTLGEAVLRAKQRMMATTDLSPQRRALDAVAGAVSPTARQLEAERAEHLDLFNLLGDPLLRIPYPQPIRVDVSASAKAGQTVAVKVASPLAGSAVVELAVRRDRLTFKPPRRARFDSGSLADYAEVYRRANEPRLAARRVELTVGDVTTELRVPAAARGPCQVRVFLEGESDCAAGGAEIQIEGAAGD